MSEADWSVIEHYVLEVLFVELAMTDSFLAKCLAARNLWSDARPGEGERKRERK